MSGDPLQPDDSRLTRDGSATSGFWRFYRAFSVLTLAASWIIAPFLVFDALLRQDYGAAAFAAACLAGATLGGLFLIRIANRTLRKRATQSVRRLV